MKDMAEQLDPAQQQEMAFFDSYMPSGKQAMANKDSKDDENPLKYPRSNEKGQGGGRGKGNDRKPAPSSKDHPKQDGDKDEGWQSWWSQNKESKSGGRIAALEQQVALLSKMSLRHEDSLNLLRAEVSFVAHAKIGCESSIVGALHRVQAGWRELKKYQPEKLDKPMRCTLILCLFREILSRVEKLPTDETALAEFKAHGWISEDLNFWPVLAWDAEQKKLLPVKSSPGLPTAVLVDHLKAVIRHCTGDYALSRFHPVRPISDTMTGESVVFLLQVGLSSDSATQLGLHLRALCMNSALQLCGCSLKPDRAPRSNLATQVSRNIG